MNYGNTIVGLEARVTETLLANASHIKALAKKTAEQASQYEVDAETYRLEGDDDKRKEFTTKAIEAAISAENLYELARRMERTT